MKAIRRLYVAVLVVSLALALGGRGYAFLQTQRDQISVYILVNVTPAPLGFRNAIPAPQQIAARMSMRARGGRDESSVPNFHVGNPGSILLAQTQSDVRVQAEVSPNPNATLLYYNNGTVIFNQTAGTTSTLSCAYTITVDTVSTTSWTLKDGLSNDFSGTLFPGNDLANNTYLQGATPNPTSTPFYVYPDNNDTWVTAEASSGMHTYCVDLTLTIPVNVPGGAYSTNAVYTLYF
jgi:hypothetical protein